MTMRALLGLLSAAILALPTPSYAQDLIVSIAIDTMPSDRLAKALPHASGGLARLSQGTSFPNATEADQTVSIAALLKAADERSRSFAVGGDAHDMQADRSFIMGDEGFVSRNAGPAPQVLAPVNRATDALIANGIPTLLPPDHCIGTEPGSRLLGAAPGNRWQFRHTPAYDGAVLTLAAALVGEFSLGKGEAPDHLAVELTATSLVAAEFGADSVAHCQQVVGLDASLGDFFTRLDDWGIDYLVILTGVAPAGDDIPVMFWHRGAAPIVRSDRISTADIAPTLAAILGLPKPEGQSGNCLGLFEGTACP